MKPFIGIIFLFYALVGVSQVKDTKASVLLDEVSAKTKSYKSIKADFSYSMENKQANIHEKKTGTLLVSGDKYRLTIAGQTVISDGKTIWTYIKESNEVQINSMDNQEETFTPSKLFTSYSTNYKSKIVQDKDATATNIVAIELIPTHQKNFTKTVLLVDKYKKQVSGFKIFDKSGNVFVYQVTKYQTNVPVTTADFIFDASAYPGVEEIDMR